MTTERTALLAVVWTLASSCDPRSGYPEFFRLSPEQQAVALPQRPALERVDIYLTGMEVHPPIMRLAFPLARGGSEVIPEVLRRLHASSEASTVADLLYVLTVMACEYRNIDATWRDTVEASAADALAHAGGREGTELVRRYHDEILACLSAG